VEEAIAIALDSWPADERAVMDSLPGISTVREAVLFSAIGDLASYRDDRQLRKMLGWYSEAKESGSSVSKHHLGHSGNRMARREIWLWAMQLLTPQAKATPFARTTSVCVNAVCPARWPSGTLRASSSQSSSSAYATVSRTIRSATPRPSASTRPEPGLR